MMHDPEKWRGHVERIRRAATAKGRASGGFFSIEGTRLHERALRAGWRVELAVLGRSFSQHTSARIVSLIDELQKNGCELVTVPDALMVDLTDGRDLGAIIGLIKQPPPLSLPDLLRTAPTRPPFLLVAADVKDPGNIGALMRTRACLRRRRFHRLRYQRPVPSESAAHEHGQSL